MKVRTKLITGFSCLMVLLLLIDGGAYFALNKLSINSKILEEELWQLDLVDRLQLATERMLMPPHDYLIHGNHKEKEDFNRRYSQMEKMFTSLENTNLTLEEKNTLDETRAISAEVKKKALEILNLESAMIGKTISIKKMEVLDRLAENLVMKIDVLSQNTYKNVSAKMLMARTFANKARRVIFYYALIIIVNVLVVCFFTLRSIGKPIRLLREGAELISQGRLEHRVHIHSHDELKGLADVFNKMVGNLEKSLADVEGEKNKLETILLNIGDGVVVGDAKYNLLFMNPVAEKILGKHYKDLLGKDFFGCHREGDKVMEILKNDLLPVSTTIDYGNTTLHINATSIKNAAGTVIGYTMIVRDVTKQERMREKLEELAVTDGLTGAYNHKYFQERLECEFERSKRYNAPLSFVMIDIDSFKNFNDRFGHQLGDEVLVALTKILKDNSRHFDTVARYGGEEFALISPNTTGHDCAMLSERLREKIECHEIKWKDSPLTITVSMGVATYDGTNFNDKAELIKAADDALYRAKEGGKNRIEIAT